MFIADFFITTKTWKQLRCFLAGEWINKLVFSDNEVLFSAEKKLPVKS